MYERYQDHETSPVNEPVEKLQCLLGEPYSSYDLIQLAGKTIGGVRMVFGRAKTAAGKKITREAVRISPFYNLPAYQNKGIGQVCR